MLKHIKNILRRRRLTHAGFTIEHTCPISTYGTDGGAWLATPDTLGPGSVIYSFGIGRDLSFDLALIARHRSTVHAFDPTPACLDWIRTQTLPAELIFHPLGLAAHDGHLDFHAPRKATSSHYTPVQRYHASNDQTVKAPVNRLATILRDLGHTKIDLLKMDIEGGEYEALTDILQSGIPIRQLLVEFHHMYETIPESKTLDALTSLRAAGFQIIAISPRTYEITLLNTRA